MNIITWNIGGLNSIYKLDIVQNFVRQHKLDYLFLQETKMDKETAEKIKSFNNYYTMAISSEGASGGTMILWKRSLFLGTLLNANKHFMVIKIKNIDQNNNWYIVNVYAPNIKNARKKVWETLSNIKSKDFYGRWIFLGNFNVPLYEHEKKGGNANQLDGRLDFMDFINKEGLMDIDIQGIEFTWSNKRIGDECIQARLDRVLISPEWTKEFVCNLKVIQKVGSNHFPLIFTTENIHIRKNFLLRFEKMWLQHPQFEDQQAEWLNINIDGTALFQVASKLKNVKNKVKILNKIINL